MRRYFEFGNAARSPLGGPWTLESNRGSPNEHGASPPAFVSMPHKHDLFTVLNALYSTQQTIVAHFWMKAGDQGVDPAADCTALHFPRNWVFPSGSILVNQAVEPWIGFPIFTPAGDFTGNYSSPLLNFTLDKPDEFGG